MANLELPAQQEQNDFFQPMEIPEGFKKAIGVVQVAMGSLGFLHRKLINVLLCNAYEGLGEGKLHFAIQVSTLANWAGFDSRDYQSIYDHCRDLLETTVEFVDFDDSVSGKRKPRRRRGATSLISDFAVTDGGLITYSYSREMAQKLYEPEQYIWMALAVQKRFSSKYELNLFENCIRYVRTGSTGFKDVEDWRALLGATEPVYNEFKNFNRKVIKEASKGVNEKSGILVEPEFEREKRRVARVRFSVREDPQMSLLDHKEHNRMRQMPACKAARKLGLKEVEAFYWIESQGEEYLADAVAYVEARNPAKNPAGYLVTTLKKGFAKLSPDEKKRIEEAEQKSLEFKAKKEAVEAAERAQESLEARFREHQRVRVGKILKTLSEGDLAQVRAEISADIPIPSLAQRWAAIDQDIHRIADLPKMMRRAMEERLKQSVLSRWGKAEDTDLETFNAATLEARVA